MKKNIFLIFLGMIILGGIITLMQWSARPKPVAALEEFAQCLTANGVKMYGAYWCPHCQNQKELFGDTFKYVTYIECASNENLEKKVCEKAGVERFPTWFFSDGSRIEGELSLDKLSEKTKCILPTAKK
ncbi:MAG: hypothetical protein HZB10_01775 [Candidatus Yonathbacteria bacterium]|nr:hypothetical protein [Candidatus Yonathbacteria bacterium]